MSMSGPTTTTTGAIFSAARVAMTCPTMGRPPMACMTLGKLDRMRVPMPAARTTAAVGVDEVMKDATFYICAENDTPPWRDKGQLAKKAPCTAPIMLNLPKG